MPGKSKCPAIPSLAHLYLFSSADKAHMEG
jgi:hypothetical protein